ncbi:extracellular solute-binding protein [Pseudalkalibacillus caeni]|uniref:Extracellular solute-binding protein n=1 Tax=Exobacillus caeni TaxID=2574798 RepID=A0A5R9F813_9BACL|nr:extracellular solute-binding protein [Pseudalkalibacillus caeni]TLS38390.1 extracellular solute-binding protein [Pseudalkalibacillus caeni]
MHLKGLRLMLSVVLMLTLLTGCFFGGGGEQKVDKEVSDSGKSDEKVTLKVYRPANVVDPKTDPILQEIGNRLGVNVEIVTAPWDQSNNKVNLMMQSQEEIDIIQAEFQASPWKQWAEDGLMYSIDELLKGKEKDFPYVESITKAESFKGLQVENERFFIPGSHHGQDTALFIRKDWLEKLNLEMPKTMDDFYNVLKAFKEKDPDGNGKDDTIGLQVTMPAPDNFAELDPVMHGFGGSFGGFFEDYVVRNDKVVPLETTDDTKDAFDFMNKLYREGLMNRDFPNLKNVDQGNAKYLYANKAGAIWTSRASEFETNIQKVDPNAKLEFVPPIVADGHEFIPLQGSAWWMMIGIPKSSKHPDEALKFIEFVNSKEGRELLVAGIKGEHYSNLTEQGIYDRNKENWEKDYDVKANGYEYPLWWGFLTTVHGYIPVEEHDTFEDALKNVHMFVSEEDSKKEFNWKTAVEYGSYYNEPNPFHAVYIDSAQDKRNTIQNNVKAVYFLKMITADSEKQVNSLWDQYINAWEDAGGKEVIQAYQDFYDENIK